MKEVNSLKTSILLVLYAVLHPSDGVPAHNVQQNHRETGPHEVLIDMGIDYNDEPVSDYFKNAITKAVANDSSMNMYYGPEGDPQLRQSIAKFYSKVMSRQLNWETEIITTIGATEALASTFRALSEPGDEWIFIEPFFNMFKTAAELANAVPRYTTLKPRKFGGNVTAADWKMDFAEMKRLINSKTRGIMFNNPNNPLGKSYTRKELEFIARLAKERNLIVVSDEAHEFTTDTMIKMAALPGMFERTLTIGSASKAFCVPGWRVGWVYGPEELIKKISKVHYDTINFVSIVQQRAVSAILEDEFKNFGSPKTFLVRNLASIKRKRDFIVQAFRDAGMLPIVPQGGYCMLAGWSAIDQPNNRNSILREGTFAHYMERTVHVHAYPADKYYGDNHKREGIRRLRFCYHKTNETLQNAAKNLLQLGTGLNVKRE